MEEKIALKIIVAGRTYPLTVNAAEQQKVLKAADDINRAIKLLQQSYAVKDMQDLLAMTALQLATKTTTSTDGSNYQEIGNIELSLEQLLNDINK
jgi:cell division protein ZapA (FtsZ GTPase activity inhibitor)